MKTRVLTGSWAAFGLLLLMLLATGCNLASAPSGSEETKYQLGNSEDAVADHEDRDQETDHAGSQRPDTETSQDAKSSVTGTEASFSFLAPNRENPSFCFQVVDVPSVTPDDVEPQLRKALEVLAQSPRWQDLHLTPDGVQITNGCPQPPYLLQEGITLPYSGNRDSVHQRNVALASVETAFVWILSEQSLNQLFGENAVHKAPEEYLCVGHMCAEVTNGLYLSPEELADSTVLAAKLSGVLIW